MSYAATMRRAACGLVIAATLTGSAAAAPWTVTVEGGGEADTNVERVETGPGLATQRVAAGVLRVGAKVDHRAKALGGAYAFVISALSRVVTEPQASRENVTLFTGELRYLRPVEARRVSFGLGLIAADAQPLTEDVGARTFRNLGADALLTFDAGDEGKTRTLTMGFGIRDFFYKEKAGFVEDGRLRESAWVRGAFVDEVIMSVLADSSTTGRPQ